MKPKKPTPAVKHTLVLDPSNPNALPKVLSSNVRAAKHADYIATTVNISPEDYADVKSAGFGNTSRGWRLILDIARASPEWEAVVLRRPEHIAYTGRPKRSEMFERDLAMYHEYMAHTQTREKLAEDYRVTPARLYQIIVTMKALDTPENPLPPMPASSIATLRTIIQTPKEALIEHREAKQVENMDNGNTLADVTTSTLLLNQWLDER